MDRPETHMDFASELEKALRPVAAPPELWNRVRAAPSAPSQIGARSQIAALPQIPPPRRANQTLVWAMAAAVILLAVGLSALYRESVGGDEKAALEALSADSQQIALHCQNPAQIRAWVRANTGLDLPLREESSPSIRLIGAQMVGGTRGAKVAYRAENRDAVLLVSRAGGAPDVPHSRAASNVSSWVMDGQRYTLAANDAADLQLACKLCHPD